MSRIVIEQKETFQVEFRRVGDHLWWLGAPSNDNAHGDCQGNYSLVTAQGIVRRAKLRIAPGRPVEYRIVRVTREVVE